MLQITVVVFSSTILERTKKGRMVAVNKTQSMTISFETLLEDCRYSIMLSSKKVLENA